ncbi:conserved hypothetical protein, membrane [mine drainage metagenome]|uniref:DoxX n=2 Tax=mine drainage metagenome TaxID=410659 RepID=T1CLI6_9ZZZZ
MTRKEQVALLLLRVGLGAFPLVWSVGKLVAPEHAVRIFAHFYRLQISPGLAIAIGIAETVLSVLFIIEAWQRCTYGLGLILHLASTRPSWRMLLDPFPHPNDLFLAGVPVLAAFAALYLLRDRDVLWAVSRRS